MKKELNKKEKLIELLTTAMVVLLLVGLFLKVVLL